MKLLRVLLCYVVLFTGHFFPLKLNDFPPEILHYIGLFLRSDIPKFNLQGEILVMPDSEEFKELSKNCQPCSFFRDEKIKSLFKKYYGENIAHKKLNLLYCCAQDARGGYSPNREKLVIAFYKKEIDCVIHVRPIPVLETCISLFNIADESLLDSFTVKGKVESLTVSSDGSFCIYCLAPDRGDSEKVFRVILYDFLSGHEKKITSFSDEKLGNLSKFHHCRVPYRPLVSLAHDSRFVLCIPRLPESGNDGDAVQFRMQEFKLVLRDNALESYFREESVCQVFPQEEVAIITKGGEGSLPIMILWSEQRKVAASC